MSVRGPRRCRCCGEEERTTGCVRGMLCGCRQFGDCMVCHFCLRDCKCTEEMKVDSARARSDYYAALRKITESNPGHVNKRW